MAHRQTTQIKLLEMRNAEVLKLAQRVNDRMERGESLATAFVFDLIQYLNSRWYTRWLVSRIQRRYAEAWKAAVDEFKGGTT